MSLPEWTLSFREGGRPYCLTAESDHREVIVELLLELSHVAHVIDAFVKASGEFRSNGLRRNAFIGQSGQDDQQLGRRLWTVRFIHRNFGDKPPFPLGLEQVPIDPAGIQHGQQVLAGHALDVGAGRLDRLLNPRYGQAPHQLRMPGNESLDGIGAGGLADPVGDVDGVKVRMGHETVDCFQPDMVGIHVIRGPTNRGL